MVVALFIALFALPQQALAKTKEAYVFKSFRENTLTFYYDTHKMKRHGIKWDINEVQMINGYSYPSHNDSQMVLHIRSIEANYGYREPQYFGSNRHELYVHLL